MDPKYTDVTTYHIDNYAQSEEDRAILSHWLHNRHNKKYAKTYSSRSESLLPNDCYFNLSNQHQSAEIASQLFFPEVF